MESQENGRAISINAAIKYAQLAVYTLRSSSKSINFKNMEEEMFRLYKKVGDKNIGKLLSTVINRNKSG